LRRSRALAHKCPASVSLIRLARTPYSTAPNRLKPSACSTCPAPDFRHRRSFPREADVHPAPHVEHPGCIYLHEPLARLHRIGRDTPPRLSKPRILQRLRRVVPPSTPPSPSSPAIVPPGVRSSVRFGQLSLRLATTSS